MQNRKPFRASVAIVCAAVLALTSGAAMAQHGGGHVSVGGGGAHVSVGVGYHGGYGGYHGGYGGYGGYRGGYGGWHGGYGGYGWRGGYYGGYGWRGYGWGLGGLGLGLYFGALPLYYSTLYWGGIPYYYADNTYYRYDSSVGQYQTVAPPDGLVNQVEGQQQPSGIDLMAYPKNGQNDEQQKKDKYECHHWATQQSGFDPTQGAPTSGTANKRGDYMRAQEACLEGRGYTVR